MSGVGNPPVRMQVIAGLLYFLSSKIDTPDWQWRSVKRSIDSQRGGHFGLHPFPAYDSKIKRATWHAFAYHTLPMFCMTLRKRCFHLSGYRDCGDDDVDDDGEAGLSSGACPLVRLAA